MKVYTLQDLETFERDDDGYLICPSGDYSRIATFPRNCSFGECCIFDMFCNFDKNCIFDMFCSFGNCCSFGECCKFGDNCSFDECCSFGSYQKFGVSCDFGNNCSFGECCNFGNNCSLDISCTFGDKCSFGNNLKFKNTQENVDRILKIDRIGSREDCTYFFKTINNIYVHCGCFLGTIIEFEEKVNKTHVDNEQYLNEYLKAIEYVKAIM